MQGKWKIRQSQSLFQSGLFRLRTDECELPDGRIMPRYYVLEFPAWVHIVAVTTDLKMIMQHQYRHAAGEWFVEIPGGSSDGHRTEDPLAAAQRELLEETGFGSENWLALGHHYPNPALQNNATHTYLARECTWRQEPCLDPYEVLEVEMMDVGEVYSRLDRGLFKHSLTVASLTLARPHLKSLFAGL